MQNRSRTAFHFLTRNLGRFAGVALLLPLIGLVACTSARPLYTAYDENGDPILVKQTARYEEWDMFHHWKRSVYAFPDFSVAYSIPAERVYDPANPAADKEGYVIAPPLNNRPAVLVTGQEKKELVDEIAQSRDRQSYESAGLTMREAEEKKKKADKVKARAEARAASQDAATSASAHTLPIPQYLYLRSAKKYRPVSLSNAEKGIVARYGVPEAVRPPYTSRTGETITDWIYLKDAVMFQFCQGRLVYQGPLTDREIILMRFGYPNDVLRFNSTIGSVRETFVYENFWKTNQNFFSFSDSKLTIGEER